MANEFVHVSVGTDLTQAEYESVTGHAFNSQATGDIGYASSATQLSRLAIGTTGQALMVSGGLPAWTTIAPARVYCRITAAGVIVANSFNVTSITDSGTGDRTIVIATDFANANYTALTTFADDLAFGANRTPYHMTFAVGSVILRITNGAAAEDVATSTAMFGDQ